ncbi:MAG: YegP family protein [Saprospiraceae bacterium]|nr:YegP family protein [Saprospiraceae bacterium]
MGKFEINKTTSGQFRFNLKASNGQVILTSESYTTNPSCLNGIDSVKTNSQIDSRFERLTARDGSPYFNLKASNGQIIGTSEMYSSLSARVSVKTNAPTASVVDNTKYQSAQLENSRHLCTSETWPLC